MLLLSINQFLIIQGGISLKQESRGRQKKKSIANKPPN